MSWAATVVQPVRASVTDRAESARNARLALEYVRVNL